ncbi:helix-turn-helix domain-containing protein [Brevundimonas sp. 374]|uniref:helix-turn-helix domain-containing protein n=1 Tax=Brevundimonas sp. 374 TaxID=1150400 RepID=UPI0008852534|nr:helix-turn-helix domain-containing protein [Brevundimonas sp. 374]SDQ79455.1 Predicted transcriptional regulator, contains an HTH and PUA-like domains [Brevundimonas sp. 374]
MTKVRGKIFEPQVASAAADGDHVGQRLREFREQAGLTQKDLATRLGIGQPALARVEHRSDILVSTLRDYLGALGATLRINARFNNSSQTIESFHEAEATIDPDDGDQMVLPLMGDAFVKPSRDVVFSIKPEYSRKIIGGSKTIELRRRFPKTVSEGTRALIYETSPTRALIGMAEISGVSRMSPDELWAAYSEEACIARTDFDNYFSGVEVGVAIRLCRARPLRRTIELPELRSRFSFEPPQSFLYASAQMRDAMVDEYA